MRLLTILAVSTLLASCSLLDQLALNSGTPKLDPNKIYLGESHLHGLRADELGKYGCVAAPMICESSGTAFSCSCP